MTEQLTALSWSPSLFESLLAQHRLERRGLQIVFAGPLRHEVAGSRPDAAEYDDAVSEERPADGAAPGEPDADGAGPGEPDGDGAGPGELDGDGLEVDDRFPALNRFGRLLEVGAGHLDAARAAHRAQCRQAALQARALAAFAEARPARLLDRPAEEVGAAAAASRSARAAALTEVSEWAVDEVMIALSLSSQASGELLADSITLAQRLPATLDALQDGRISWAHARMLAAVVGPVKDEVRADVEARLLARAEGKTVAQLRVAANRAVLKADAAAHTKRLAAAIRDRSVRAYPGRDGMGTLAATMPIPLLEACRGALRAYAEECTTPGDEHTLDQRMLDCLADLILRPGQTDLPPVQAQLTIVATAATMAGGNEPGEINGQPVSAEQLRELAYALGLLPRPHDTEPPTTEPPDEPTEPDEPDESDAQPGIASDGEPDAEADRALRGRSEPGIDGAGAADVPPEAPDPRRPVSLHQPPAPGLGQLLALPSTAGTTLSQLPRIAIVEELSGQLLALTNATTIRHAATCRHPQCRTGQRPCTHPPAGPGLGPPPPTDGYSPSDPLARFVRARDRRCRFPGCRAAAIRCDLDHNRPWPHGTTSAENLCCLCRHHHRLSHQAPGWTMTRLPDGGLQWTTPSGHTITTHPIGYGTDDDLPPPPPDQTPPPPDPNEDPPPF
jgi:hypothetical protein